MRLHRLIAILLLLESRGQLKARELADALETSERTVHRDIATLCEAGIPIEATAGPTGGFRLLDGYTRHLPHLPHDEAIGLFLRGIGLQPREAQEAYSDVRQTLGQLASKLPEAYRQDVRIAQRRFYFDPTPWWEGVPVSIYLDILRQAVWHARKVAIAYENMRHEVSDRIVQPYGLVVKAMQWYLVAYCEQRDEVRTFKVRRIRHARLLDDAFTIPEDFTLEAYWTARATAFTTEVTEREEHLWR